MGTNQFLGFPYISLYRLVPQSVKLRNSNIFLRKITTGLSLCATESTGEKTIKTIFQDDYRANVPSYHHLICRISISLRTQNIKIKISISNELFEITVDRIRKPRDWFHWNYFIRFVFFSNFSCLFNQLYRWFRRFWDFKLFKFMLIIYEIICNF